MSDKKRLEAMRAMGAEYLALGYLLSRGVEAALAPPRMPGYDILTLAGDRIQVKSRQKKQYGVFVGDMEYEYLVTVEFEQPPIYRVIPGDIVRKYHTSDGSGNKIMWAKIPDVEQYRDRWDLVRESSTGSEATNTAEYHALPAD